MQLEILVLQKAVSCNLCSPSCPPTSDSSDDAICGPHRKVHDIASKFIHTST